MKPNEYLDSLIAQGKVGRTLLFCGYDVAEKEKGAKAFARKILGSKVDAGVHPDLHIYKPEGKIGLHSISSIRQLIQEVYMPPHEGKNKIFIIHDAERMLPTSANALLKTLEEPNLDTTLILLASSSKEVLPTIVSRCQVLYFPSSQTNVPEQNQKIIQILASSHSYLDLLDQVKEVAGDLEILKKRLEKESRDEILGKQSLKDLSASQAEVLQKEVEGAVSLLISKEEMRLIQSLFSWYRDIHLIKAGADLSYLIHKEHIQHLQEKAKKPVPTLSVIQKHIAKAKLALERSAPFTTTLENLFLKLQ